MKIGAHLSIAKGHAQALTEIIQMGGNALQIFSQSPRNWGDGVFISEETAEAFKKKKKELGINPVYFHASYLVNLADGDRIGAFSRRTLIAELKAASLMDIRGTIVHLGSFKEEKTDGKFRTLIANIKEILAATPENTGFIIENAGNNKIGKDIEEIRTIIEEVGSDRVKVCLDTCHLHAAGYDLRTEILTDFFLDDFEKKIGLNKLEVFHINDSRDEFGSGRDRHENLGEGRVGTDVFRLLVNHPKVKHLPFIIETPGFQKKGPDKRNMDILKGLIG